MILPRMVTPKGETRKKPDVEVLYGDEAVAVTVGVHTIVMTRKQALQVAYRIVQRFWERA